MPGVLSEESDSEGRNDQAVGQWLGVMSEEVDREEDMDERGK